MEPWPLPPDAYVVVDPLRNAIANVGIGPVDHYFVRWAGMGGTTMPAQHCYYVSFREEARTLAVLSDVEMALPWYVYGVPNYQRAAVRICCSVRFLRYAS